MIRLMTPISPILSGLRSGVIAFGLILVAGSPAMAAVATKAPHAFLMDAQTGAVLLDKEGDAPMAPASMSKLMTVFMLLEALKEGRVSLDSMFSVSEYAWQHGGAASGSSTMFLKPHEQVKVEDLLRGIIIQSGNDACIVVAENLGVTEAEFAQKMTKRAREIGLTDSTFANATGWPSPEQKMSARDLARLARELITRFPTFYEVFSEKQFVHNGIKQGNRNPLLYRFPGADGLKTGHTDESGYGLVGSAKVNDRRLILVVNGLATNKDRSEESERLLNWGFSEFTNVTLFKRGETVDSAEVWLGAKTTVSLQAPDDMTFTMPRAARRDMKVSVVVDQPVAAPIKAGQKVATLKVSAPGMDPIERPLLAAESIDRLGFTGRIVAAAKYLFWGYSR
jgi:serine-type D-Ala-D-Ala carboxypeptidase (penicillin-binding protein 5/6)